jgi:hypothetical protein
MRVFDKFQDSFARNPMAWILFALPIIAEFGNYSRGRELSRVCELLGLHDVAIRNPRTAKEEIDNICIGRLPSDD